MSPIWYTLIILIIIAIAIVIIISQSSIKKINITSEKYSNYKMTCDITVEELSTILISNAKLSTKIATVGSKNSDVYSAKYNVLKISPENAKSVSIVSLGNISHQIGNAIQNEKNVSFYKFKTKLLPVINIFLISFIPLFLLGLAFAFSFNLNTVGLVITIVSFVILVISIIFYLITLISINKSSEEICYVLDKLEFLTENELVAIKTVIYENSSQYLFNIIKYLFFFIYSATNSK